MITEISLRRTTFGGPSRFLSQAVLAVTLLLGADQALAAPAIVNGSMTGTPAADTAPTGWVKVGSTPDVVDATGPFNNTGVDWILSPDGGTFARLNGTVDPEFREAIEQTVDGFDVGVSYSFDFSITNLGFYVVAGDDWRDRPGFIELYVDDVLVGQSSTVIAGATPTSPNQWTADGIAFMASASSHTLRIEGRTTDATVTAYLGVDGAGLSLAGGTTTTSVPTTSSSSTSTSNTSSSSSTSTSSSSTSSTSSSSATSTTSPSTSTSTSSSTSTSVPGGSTTSTSSSTSVTTPTSSTSSTTSSSSTTATSATSTTSTTTLLPASTTTTSTTTSTTTTTAPPLCVPGACDDGDACTTDTCEPLVGCVATPVGGLAGATCLLGQLTDPEVCGADPLDAKLAKFVTKRVTRARRAIDKASEVSTARKVLKQLRKVARELKKIARRVARFERKERITPECAAAFRDLLCRTVSETDVADVLAPPCPF